MARPLTRWVGGLLAALLLLCTAAAAEQKADTPDPAAAAAAPGGDAASAAAASSKLLPILCTNLTGGCLGEGVQYPFKGSLRLGLTGKEIIMTTNIKLKAGFDAAQFVALRNAAVTRFKQLYLRNPAIGLNFENMLFLANSSPTTFGPLNPGFEYFDVGVILVAKNSLAVQIFRQYFSQQPEVTSTLPWIDTDVRATDAV